MIFREVIVQFLKLLTRRRIAKTGEKREERKRRGREREEEE